MSTVEDQFHHRLSDLERHANRYYSAPTFPIYDVNNFPQDSFDGQVAIGTDDSINWYSSGAWHTQAPTDPTIVHAPIDALEGQIVTSDDNSLCWFSNGAWHGGAGVVCTGNPPIDPIDSQLALGNDILCWRNGDNWFTFGAIGGFDRFLSIYGDRYNNNLPGMYYILSTPVSEAWLRFSIRNDVLIHYSQAFLAGFVFSEAAAYGYYNLADNTYWNFVQSIWVNMPGIFSAGWAAHPYNSSQISYNYQNYYGGNSVGLKPVVDLHVAYSAPFTGPGGGVGGTWLVEVYVDNVLRFSGSDNIWGDTGHPLGTGTMGAINIPSHYGDYQTPIHVALDDISAGTTQGGTDLLPVQDFNDGSFGLFNDGPQDDPTFPVYEVTSPFT